MFCLLIFAAFFPRKTTQKESFPGRKSRNRTDFGDRSSSDDLSDCDLMPPQALRKLKPAPQDGASAYRTAIESIGSSVQRRLEAEQNLDLEKEADQSLSRGSLPALMDEMEDVGDDWLINDVDYVRPNRKNSQVAGLLTTSSSRSTSRKRSIEDGKALPEKSKLSTKRSKLTRVENLPNISSSEDFNTIEAFCDFKTVSNRRKDAHSHPELSDDQSSSDACPVTSSTERQEAVLQIENSQNDQNVPTYAWDSDEELLSFMDHVDDSFGNHSSSLIGSQLNESASENLQSDSAKGMFESVDDSRPSVTRKKINSYSGLTKEQSKISTPSLTLHTDRHASPRPNPSHVCISNSSQSHLPPHESRNSTGFSSLQQPQCEHEMPQSFLMQPQLQQQQLTQLSFSTAGGACNSTSLRVKVKIADQTLLIPIQPSDQQRTILWLCQQAGQRYFNMFLVRPLLALNTSDGSVLSPTDTISSVLTENEVLTAIIRSWERPKLEERYLQACTLCLLEEPNKLVVPFLRDCDTTGILKLIDLGLSSVLLQPVFQAVEGQRTLTEVHLTGNRLTDSGVTPLMELLAGLPILKVIICV